MMVEVSEKRFDEQEQEIAALRLLVEQRQAELASVMRANSNKLDTIKNLNEQVTLLRDALHDYKWNKDQWGFIKRVTEIIEARAATEQKS